jgi:hypothetical protein
MDKETLFHEITSVFDTHEHFGVFNSDYRLGTHQNSLHNVIKGAYLNSDNSPHPTYDTIYSGLKPYVGSDAFLSLRTGLKDLYDVDLYPLSIEKLKVIDAQIMESYQNSNYILDILQKKMHVSKVILDIPQKMWKNWDQSLFIPTIRIDETIFPFSTIYHGNYRTNTSNPNEIQQYAQEIASDISTLDHFDDVLEKYVMNLSQKARVIKIGSAYQRSIEFEIEENNNHEIDKIFSKMKEKNATFSEKEMRRWGNYIITFLFNFAQIEQLPVQIHTGLALMAESSPVRLVNFMRSFSSVHFDLFHGGYPYSDALAGVLYTRSNAYADLCWMPILNQNATKRLLNDLIAVGRWNRTFAFGGDCQTIEGSYGALLVVKKILVDVLYQSILDDRLTTEDAILIGNAMLSHNAQQIYKF